MRDVTRSDERDRQAPNIAENSVGSVPAWGGAPPHSLRQEGAVTAGLASSLRATRMPHVGIVLSDRSWLDCRSGQPRSACTFARAEASPSRRPEKPAQSGTECWRECGPVCRPLVRSEEHTSELQSRETL